MDKYAGDWFKFYCSCYDYKFSVVVLIKTIERQLKLGPLQNWLHVVLLCFSLVD